MVIPSIKAIFKGIELAICTSVYSLILRIFLNIYFFYFNTISLTYFYLGIIIIACILAIFIYGFLHQFLWGNPDPNPHHLKFLPSNNSIIEAGIMLLFAVISTLTTILLMAPFLYHFIQDNDWQESLENKTLKTAIISIWILTASYLYHFRNLICQNKIISK